MKRFYVYPEIVTPGSPGCNVVEPETDLIYDNGVDEPNAIYNTDEQISVEIVTENGNWDSMGVIRDIYSDEFGVLLSVEVDWGAAVLIASEK